MNQHSVSHVAEDTNNGHVAPAKQFDLDLFFAVFLHEEGISGPPTADMPEWKYDGLAFLAANQDIAQFIGTPEYQYGVALAHFHM